MNLRLPLLTTVILPAIILANSVSESSASKSRAVRLQRVMAAAEQNAASARKAAPEPTAENYAAIIIDTTTNTQRLFQGIARDPLPPSVTVGAMTRYGQRTQTGVYRGMPALAGNTLEDGIVLSTTNVNQINSATTRIISPLVNVGEEPTPSPGFQREDIMRIARETSRSEEPIEDYKIYDASSFKVEFTTTADIKSISVDFVYGSDEYPTWVESDYNDVFVIMLDGRNIAFDSQQRAISVANNFFQVPNIDLEDANGGGDIYHVRDLRINGFTPPLRAQANLAAGKHTLEFSIVDISDAVFNSSVFLTNLRFNTNTVTPGTGVRVDFINDQSFTVPETLPPGSQVGVVETLLPRDSLVLSLLSGHPALSFDPATGRLSVAAGQSLAPYRDQAVTLQVVARKQNQADTARVEVRVTAVPPSDLIQDQTFTVLETLPPGGEVGLLATLVSKDSLTLSLLTGPAAIALDANSGRLSVAPAGSLTPYRGQTMTFQVVARKGGQADTAKVSVIVTAVAAPIISATRAVYFDADGDGRIDQAQVEFAAPPRRAPERVGLHDPFASPASAAIEVSGAAIAPLDAIRYRLDFANQEFAFGTAFANGNLATLLAPDSVFSKEPFPVEDGVGPLPTLAEAIGPQKLGDKPTLTLDFSEPVKLGLTDYAFPYHIKRPGKDLGPIVVESIRDLGGNRFLYTFSSPEYPLPGDSLQALTGNPHLEDARGNKVRMSYYIPVVGKHPVPPTVLQVRNPGLVTLPPLANLVRLDDPILVESVHQPGGCVGCLDPARQSALQQVSAGKPVGEASPILMQVKTSGPIRYQLRFFSNRGEFVNRAEGAVDATMLQSLPKDGDGNYLLNLYWWPVSPDGQMAGTGAYILRGSIQGTGEVDMRMPVDPKFTHLPNRAGNISLTFGFIRR